jgi:Ran GTPase-activating protein (RanGAP) involved in mRNA processing and transport
MELLERLAANDPQLTELDDVPCSVVMRELATALALNTTLTYLGLTGRGLVDADAHELAGAL